MLHVFCILSSSTITTCTCTTKVSLLNGYYCCQFYVSTREIIFKQSVGKLEAPVECMSGHLLNSCLQFVKNNYQYRDILHNN